MTTQVPSNDDNNLKHNDSVASSLSSTSSKRHLVGGGSSSSNDNNNSFLSSKKTKIIKMAAKSTSKTEEQTEFVPPDGGFQAWLVMICSFLCNGVIFGIHNSFGVLFDFLKEQRKDDPDAATKASSVGSLAIGMTFLLSPISSILVDRYGVRRTAFVGGLIAFLGMLLSSFAFDRVEFLYLTYGLMFGGGSSLTYTPSLVILGHYFKKHMGVVNGFVTTGSSVFTVILPHFMNLLLEHVGLKKCLYVLSALTSIQMFAALNFKPLMPKVEEDHLNGPKKNCIQEIIYIDNWKNTKYVIWALAIPASLFGYFVPYIHIVAHVHTIWKNKERDGGVLVSCMGITSGLGRLIFGKIADLPKVNRILLQQISFVSIGICTMLLVAAPYFTGFEFESMIVFALIMGLFDGCFISMLGPIAFDICGPAGANQAIGCLLGLCSIPLTFGPQIAGILFDQLGNYTLAFILAGIPPILGAFLMCLIYKIKSPEPDRPQPSNLENATLPSGEALVPSQTATTVLSEQLVVETESLLKPQDTSVKST